MANLELQKERALYAPIIGVASGALGVRVQPLGREQKCGGLI